MPENNWILDYMVDNSGNSMRNVLSADQQDYTNALTNNPNNEYVFSPENMRKSAVERQNQLGGALGLEGLQKLYGILQTGQGLSPQQRGMLSAVMQRSLGMAAEQSGQGLGRRLAAQGISNTGLANSSLAQVLSGSLSAQRQANSELDQQSLNAYFNALQNALGQNQFLRGLNAQERTAAKDRKANTFKSIFDTAKAAAEAAAAGG